MFNEDSIKIYTLAKRIEGSKYTNECLFSKKVTSNWGPKYDKAVSKCN